LPSVSICREALEQKTRAHSRVQMKGNNPTLMAVVYAFRSGNDTGSWICESVPYTVWAKAFLHPIEHLAKQIARRSTDRATFLQETGEYLPPCILITTASGFGLV